MQLAPLPVPGLSFSHMPPRSPPWPPRRPEGLRYGATARHDATAATLASFELCWSSRQAVGKCAWLLEVLVRVGGPLSARKPAVFKALLPTIGLLPEGGREGPSCPRSRRPWSALACHRLRLCVPPRCFLFA